MIVLRTLDAAMVIARRDFTATVASRAFLFFLLGPLFPVLFGLLFGNLGANVAVKAEQQTVAVIANPAEVASLSAARDALSEALQTNSLPRLRGEPPESDRSAQVARLLASPDQPVVAVLDRPFTAPHLTGQVQPDGALAGQVGLIVATARSAPPPRLEVTTTDRASGSTATGRAITAHAGQTVLFLLTLLLAGMLLSQLIEEKSNKVIEVLAAAVPVDAIFLGKLFAMLAVSLVGIAVWASVAVGAVLALSPEALGRFPAPALGWPGFGLMALLYFCFGYLLIGGVFLGIGAQASTVREVQTLSMPVTMMQLLIFALSAAAATDPGSPASLMAAVFPLSSPYAMLAMAASDGRWWPHLLAIVWQVLWLALILQVAARIFRRSVLKSGPRRRWFGLGRRRAASPS